MTKRKIEYWVIPPDADGEFVANMEEVLETYEKAYDPDSVVFNSEVGRKRTTKAIACGWRRGVLACMNGEDETTRTGHTNGDVGKRARILGWCAEEDAAAKSARLDTVPVTGTTP